MLLETASDSVHAGAAIQWIQTGSAAGFAGLTWYLVTKGLPTIAREFKDALTDQRREFTTTLERQAEVHTKVLSAVQERADRELATARQDFHTTIQRVASDFLDVAESIRDSHGQIHKKETPQ